MGHSHSKQIDIEVPRRSQNRLSKPRTSTYPPSDPNLLTPAPRRNSSRLVLPVPEEDESSGPTLDNSIPEFNGGWSRRSSLSTRQRIRDSLFRPKSSDGRSRTNSLLLMSEESSPYSGNDGWANFRWSDSHYGANKASPEIDRQLPSRPTSRRSSTAYTPYSHHASRLSLVVEANTIEPNMIEASRRLERYSQRASYIERTHSEASIIPMRRRSMLMTPGVATRRDSTGEVAREPVIVARRLSTAGTLGSRNSRRNSWFDQLPVEPCPIAELPVTARLSIPPPSLDEVPRTVTPSEQAFSELGAYKLGTLRITNANIDVHEDEEGLSIKVPSKPTRSQKKVESNDCKLKLIEKVQDQLDSETLSPFSFEKSRSPSPQLQPQSKHTAVEDELFEDEVEPGTPEDALRILDGKASKSKTPSPDPPQPAPVIVLPDSQKVLNKGSKEVPYKPLTKNDSGYSSNVSLRSFKGRSEGRTARKSSEKEKQQSDKSQPVNVEVVASKESSVTLAVINAPPPVPEKPVEQKVAVPTILPVAEPSKQRNFRQSLSIKRRSIGSGSKETDQTQSIIKSPTSLIRRLTNRRTISHMVVTGTSHKVDLQIPPVSASAEAKLEERQKDYPTLTHTYKSTSTTNSRETLTTILSMSEAADAPVMALKSLEALNSVSTPAPPKQGKNCYSPFSPATSPVLEEKPKSSTWQRRLSKDEETQDDFENHITSFGTVSQSLGASPYDVALSAMAPPRKRSQSFYNIAPERLSNGNRSQSAHDLAAYNVSSQNPKARKGMDANTASQLAREKSKDRELARRATPEKLRDDRMSLPSNRLAIRTSMSPSSSPIDISPRDRRSPASAKSSKCLPKPPLTMSPYRKSLNATPSPVSDTRSMVPGPAASPNHYPQSGHWLPPRPHVRYRQSATDISSLASSNRHVTRRPSFDHAKKLSDWARGNHVMHRTSSTQNLSSYSTRHSSSQYSTSYNTSSSQYTDKYYGGHHLDSGYDAGCEVGCTIGMKRAGLGSMRRKSVDSDLRSAGGPKKSLFDPRYAGVDYHHDIPVLHRIEQEA